MSNSITHSILNDFKPQLVITVYKCESEYYLESHDIDDLGRIMAGKPLLQETIQGMVDVFFDERKNTAAVSGIIPDNLLNYEALPGGHYKMTWYRPAEKRILHHKSQLKIDTGNAWVPALLYSVNTNSLSIMALKDDKRPKEITKVYRPPFFNVSDYGDVCLGSARVQKPKFRTYENLMKYWEDLFWLSEFTHLNGDTKIKSKDLQKLWRSLVGTRKKFPVSELLITDRTVKNYL